MRFLKRKAPTERTNRARSTDNFICSGHGLVTNRAPVGSLRRPDSPAAASCRQLQGNPDISLCRVCERLLSCSSEEGSDSSVSSPPQDPNIPSLPPAGALLERLDNNTILSGVPPASAATRDYWDRPDGPESPEEPSRGLR